MYENERNEYEDARTSGYSPESASEAPAAPSYSGQDQSVQSYGPQQGQSYTSQQGQPYTSQQSQPYTSQQSQPYTSQQGQSYTSQQTPFQGSQQDASYAGQPEPPYSRVNMSHIPQEPARKPKRKGSLAAKVAGVTAAAVLFGTVAGGTMFGVNTLGEYVKSKTVPETETQAPVSVKTAEPQAPVSAPAASGSAQAVAMDVSAIVEKAMPSVVAINSTTVMERQIWFGASQQVEVPSSGSGIIVGQNNDELLIVTNNHVVADSKELAVTFIDDFYTNAAIKGTDSESDLAVIAVPTKDIPAETMDKIAIATMGDSDALKVGQGVIAIGNALGYGQSVTVGYVSALDREVKADDQTTRNLLQTDAAINPGNSGGALLNMRGEVIGINAAKYSSTEVEGMGYAIPISKAQVIINELMNKKTRVEIAEDKQGYLGIQGQNIDETAALMYGMPRGVYVYKITEDGAAAKSDLREKDIITKFDGQSVRSMADLKKMLTYYEGGTTVTLTVQSLENGEYKERSVDVTLGFKPVADTN